MWTGICVLAAVPAGAVPVRRLNEFELGMGLRTSIHKVFPQAVPGKPIIEAETCTKLTKGKCGICEKVCPTNAIRYDDKEQLMDVEVGAIVMATGYDLFHWEETYGEYGYGKYPDVITSLHFERLVSSGGPTGDQIDVLLMAKCRTAWLLSNALAPGMIPKARATVHGLAVCIQLNTLTR